MKQLVLVWGGVSLLMCLSLLVLLVINPASQREVQRPGAPLRVYLDTSISFYEQQPAALAFLQELAGVWRHPLQLYPFASTVGEPISLAAEDVKDLQPFRRFARQTHYQELGETLRFLPRAEPKVVISDFIFSDFFAPQPQPRLFFYNPKLATTTVSPLYGVFIENTAGDYRPPPPTRAPAAAEAAAAGYPFTARVTVYAAQTPAAATLTLQLLAPTRKVLLTVPLQLSNRLETFDFPLRLQPQSALTLQAELRVSSAAAAAKDRYETYRDSMNFLSTTENIPVALFIFKPFKDVGLIKRTLKRYGFFELSAHTFLQTKGRLARVQRRYAELKAGLSSANTGLQAPLCIVLGGDDEVLAFFRAQTQPFINVPKLGQTARTPTPLSVASLAMDADFINLTGNRRASEELWQRAGVFMLTEPLPLPAGAKAYQRDAAGQSFLFRKGSEVYVGINGFYELNQALVTSADFADADVFWVRLLEQLYTTAVTARAQQYLHNYLLGQPIENSYLQRTLRQLEQTDAATFIVPPQLTTARAYALAEGYYHYRAELREYYPVYDFRTEQFASAETILEALRELSAAYEADVLIVSRRLRSYQLPYILLLGFLLSYLLAKVVYARLQ